MGKSSMGIPAGQLAAGAGVQTSMRRATRTRRVGTLNQLLRDLHRVGGCAFADLVATYEKLDAAAVVAADVLADAADEHVVLSAGFEGHGEMIGRRVVHD